MSYPDKKAPDVRFTLGFETLKDSRGCEPQIYYYDFDSDSDHAAYLVCTCLSHMHKNVCVHKNTQANVQLV